ncbi:hypothetical protein BDW66DRAFT_137727 [Aspergillus desertorum]
MIVHVHVEESGSRTLIRTIWSMSLLCPALLIVKGSLGVLRQVYCTCTSCQCCVWLLGCCSHLPDPLRPRHHCPRPHRHQPVSHQLAPGKDICKYRNRRFRLKECNVACNSDGDPPIACCFGNWKLRLESLGLEW